MIADLFTCYVYELMVISGEDTTYGSGGAGIGTWYGTNICMDGFPVNSVLP